MELERWRVVQLSVLGPRGRDLATGYLVRRDLVLTCAHAVEGASPPDIEIRFPVTDPVQPAVVAGALWFDGNSGTDLALIGLAPVPSRLYLDGIRYARLTPSAEQVAARILGYPQWKLRDQAATSIMVAGGKKFRDLADVRGRIRLQAGFRSGTFEFVLDDAAPSTDKQRPWDGMSGAAVWVAGRIVGLVAEHHPDEGGSRLAVRPIGAVYGLPPAERAHALALLGLPRMIADLQDASGLVAYDTRRLAPTSTSTFDFVLRQRRGRTPIDRGLDYIIGRNDGCEIRLADPRASGQHARVSSSFDGPEGPRLHIVDLRSRNGTRINGRLLIAGLPQSLQDGDIISIGGDVLVVEDNRIPE